jgi:PhoPQ-activated pathogenicity-related protein
MPSTSNASGDQFFLPIVAVLLQRSPGETAPHVPNAGHGSKTDAIESLQAFYASFVKGVPRPSVRWTFEKDGSIKVVAKDRPDAVVLWQATNPKARNFRHDLIGPAYTSTPLQPSGPNTWVARVQKLRGLTAFSWS